MAKQTVSDRLLKTQQHLSEVCKNFENNKESTHELIINSIASQTENEIDELEEKIRKVKSKDAKKRREENERFDAVEQVHKSNIAPLKKVISEMEDTIRLYSIKNNLEKTDTVGWMNQKEVDTAEHHTCKILDLAAIHVIIGEATNSYRRKINPFEVRIRVEFFNYKLNDMFKKKNIINWDSLLALKYVPGINAGMDWLAKNYDKSVASFLAYHDELIEKMSKLDIDPVKEFDFRLLKMNVARRTILRQTKNILVVSYEDEYPNRTTLEVTHVGQLSFNVAMTRDVDDKTSTGNKIPEELALELINDYHPLGLRKDQVKFYKATPAYKYSPSKTAKSVLKKWRKQPV